jgi:hypothetical protein
MTITMHELVESRPQTFGDDQNTAELIYRLDGTHDDVAAKAHADANCPLEYEGLTRVSVELEPIDPDEETATGAWKVTARYSGQQIVQLGGEGDFAFEISGQTVHVTHSKATVAVKTIPDYTPKNYKGAVGVSGPPGDITIEGADVETRAFTWSETHRLSASTVTWAYRRQLAALYGKVNNASFRGWPAYEVKFLGASGSKRGRDEWEITFRFAQSPNVSGGSIGDITGIDKKGWEYVWVRFEEMEVDNALTARPVQANVEQLEGYGEVNFELLGIGTGA